MRGGGPSPAAQGGKAALSARRCGRAGPGRAAGGTSAATPAGRPSLRRAVLPARAFASGGSSRCRGPPSSCETTGPGETHGSAPQLPPPCPSYLPASRGPGASPAGLIPSGFRRLTVQSRGRCSLGYSPRAVVLPARAGAYGCILRKVRLYIIKMSMRVVRGPPVIAFPSSSLKMSLNGFISVFIFHHLLFF